MRLVMFQNSVTTNDHRNRPGLLTENGVVDLSDIVRHLDNYSPQTLMADIIDNFDLLRDEIELKGRTSDAIPLLNVKLRPPLARPGKIMCCIGNYWEHMQRDPRPLNFFLKNPDAVVGHGDTIILPKVTDPYVFHHEAELAIVLKGPEKELSRADYKKAIFGYTCIIDVSARAQGRSTWRQGSWMGKSFDTFAPIGPCILTSDEIEDPNDLEVRFWNSGELYHQYNTNDMEHRVPEIIEFVTSIMTVNTGDVIACGTNHEGLGPLQDGDIAEIEIQQIGRMALQVTDPLKRTWERGIYVGPNSTAPAARQDST